MALVFSLLVFSSYMSRHARSFLSRSLLLSLTLKNFLRLPTPLCRCQPTLNPRASKWKPSGLSLASLLRRTCSITLKLPRSRYFLRPPSLHPTATLSSRNEQANLKLLYRWRKTTFLCLRLSSTPSSHQSTKRSRHAASPGPV